LVGHDGAPPTGSFLPGIWLEMQPGMQVGKHCQRNMRWAAFQGDESIRWTRRAALESVTECRRPVPCLALRECREPEHQEARDAEKIATAPGAKPVGFIEPSPRTKHAPSSRLPCVGMTWIPSHAGTDSTAASQTGPTAESDRRQFGSAWSWASRSLGHSIAGSGPRAEQSPRRGLSIVAPSRLPVEHVTRAARLSLGFRSRFDRLAGLQGEEDCLLGPLAPHKWPSSRWCCQVFPPRSSEQS
jgi:hypothetical protein